MQIFDGIREADVRGPTFLTIGNFDGLHRGHQALLARLMKEAAAASTPAATALLTFDPHPMKVLRPATTLHLLSTPRQRLIWAGEQGIDYGIVQPFTRELVALSAEEFTDLLVRHVQMSGLVVGPDFALGKNRGGTLSVLRELGEEKGFRLIVLDPVSRGGTEVRSLAVRDALAAGDVVQAHDLLGRPYQLNGVVQRGDQRGRSIGVPTANLVPDPERMLPADGVYATWAWLGDSATGQRLTGVTNVGVRPTVDGRRRLVETHLFNFPRGEQSGDIYGRSLTVAFLQRLRDEQKFDSFDALVGQIQQDLVRAQLIHAAFDAPVEDGAH